MQNGQSVSNSNQDFSFTPESGYVVGNPDIDNSLNTDAYSPNRDPRNVGTAAIYSTDAISSNPESTISTNEIAGELVSRPERITSKPELAPAPVIDPNQGPELGEIIESSPSVNEPDQNETKEFDTDDIKIDKNLNDKAVRKIEEKLNRKLSSDKDANYYYRNVRKAMIANIENSFGELANWKGNAA